MDIGKMLLSHYLEQHTYELVYSQVHFSTIFTFIAIGRQSDLEKDLEILILRKQLSILQRKLNHTLRPIRIEKMTLAVLANKIR